MKQMVMVLLLVGLFVYLCRQHQKNTFAQAVALNTARYKGGKYETLED